MSQIKIKKAVIACGGLGTRFLPITKAVAKELLPIIDTPVLSYVVDEAASSGASDILIILSRGKEMIKNYLEPSPVLEERLLNDGKITLYELLKSTIPKSRIHFVYQEKPLGSGDALLYAQDFVRGEPFFLSYADDLICAKTPALKQLGDVYKDGAHVVGVKRILGDDISLYGAAKINSKVGEELFLCDAFEEKKPANQAPSNLAAMGRYLFSPEIFDQLKHTSFVNGELRLTDALNPLCLKGNVYAKTLDGVRYDCGDKFGALTAAIEFGLEREFSSKLKEYLKNLVKTF